MLGSQLGMRILPNEDLLMKYAQLADRRKAQRPDNVGAPDSSLATQEAQVLSQERALKASSPGAKTATTYQYEVGPDGKRYIVGAEVSITGSEDAVDAVGGGTKRESLKPAASRTNEKQPAPEEKTQNAKAEEKPENAAAKTSGEDSPEVKAQIKELERIEREVVAHEAAHMAAGGQFAGGVSYSYTKGPDGKNYITGGEVPISLQTSDNPHETLQNAAQVMRAALAPADPSGPDMGVAAAAAQMQAQARAQLAKESAPKIEAEDSGDDYAGSLWDMATKASGTMKKGESKIETGGEDGGISRAASSAGEAYAETASPKGLWSASHGYEPHDGTMTDAETAEKNRRSALDIAA